jgi:putative PIN family toxin of toxin-antitoxin system
MPIRAVLDTNVLVSGLIGEHSPPRQIVDAWLDGRYTLVTSLYQIEELHHVLTYPRIARQVRLADSELEMILVALLSQAEVVPGRLHLPGVTRDPKDDPLVACAQEGGAGYIVSGDQDLLALSDYEGIQVVSPRQFVDSVLSGEEW